MDNEGNWHNIKYCPICGAKMDEIEEEKMPKLIDANEILKSEHQHYAPMADEYYVTVRDIENAPPVDAVPVVRCEDCEFSLKPEWDSDEVYCTKHNNWFKINGYCHLGRKERR